MAINEVIKRAIEAPGLYWYIAPSYRQAKSIAWTRLKFLLKEDNNWKFNEQELSATHMKIDTKIELKGADNEDSLRGVGLHGCVIDEAAMVKANVWPEIVRPMLADTQGWAMFISTPKGRNWLYDLYMINSADWQNFHHSTRINEFILAKEIDQMKLDMSERLFSQEVEAAFLDDETGVFKRVKMCVTGQTQEPEPGRFYVIGVDLGRKEDFTVCTVIDSVTRHVVCHERFNQISWTEIKGRIQSLAIKYNNALVWIDSTGIGDPIFEDLQNAGLSIEGFNFGLQKGFVKHELVDQLAIAIEQRQITFPPIQVLIDELMQFEYTLSDGGRIKYSAPSGKHDDCVISLGLAVWGIRLQLKEAQLNQTLPDIEIFKDRQGMGELVERYRTVPDDDDGEYFGDY